ncbi:MAG: hypothetical protein GTN76_16085 [Candidatus Aenigmarchaeota archaeon]|nr:hypothetical protein [Candidatus Aenigmarchaeota archaeon]
MDLSLCKICKEPIWNFLCVDCIAEDVKKVIPREAIENFSAFHRGFAGNFNSHYDHTYCLKCRHENSVTICPYCYLTEMLSMLSDREPILAKRMVRLLPFYRHPYSERDARTLTELSNEKTAFGMCDECGESCESLEKKDNGWLCEDCRV